MIGVLDYSSYNDKQYTYSSFRFLVQSLNPQPQPLHPKISVAAFMFFSFVRGFTDQQPASCPGWLQESHGKPRLEWHGHSGCVEAGLVFRNVNSDTIVWIW